MTKSIHPSKLPALIDSNALVIDARSPAEYRSAHVAGAKLQPLDQFDATAFCEAHGTSNPVYVLCQSGKRARTLVKQLETAGHEAAYVVEGGTDAADKAGVQIERGKGGISIERQVRIGAGSLILAGSLCGLLIHTGFFAVPIFVGSGLIFAGLTDICGMGAMLAKCPWNQ